MASREAVVLVASVVGALVSLLGSGDASAGFCYYCGSNAATLEDGVVFDELNLLGPGKPDGPTIEGAAIIDPDRALNVQVKLHLNGNELEAWGPSNVFKGQGPQGLHGLTLYLKSVRNGQPQHYEVRLTAQTDRLFFWAKPEQEVVPTYIFAVVKLASERPVGQLPEGCPETNPDACFKDFVCTQQPPEGLTFTEEEKKDPLVHAAIVFDRNRFLTTPKGHVVRGQPKGWFNFACLGTATSKMQLLRHTKAGAAPQHNTTTGQRNAMLRALTADYCSDGRSWTHDGTPLYWTDRRQWFPVAKQINSPKNEQPHGIEAAWDQNGRLICLDEPRRTPGPVTDGNCTSPAVTRRDVTCAHVHRCNGYRWTTGKGMKNAYVMTLNRQSTLPTPARDYCK